MSRASIDFSMIKEELMKDNEFKEEYENLKPRYEVITEVIKIKKRIKFNSGRIGFPYRNTKIKYK